MRVLVDTGAQINLVRPGITPLTPARHPLSLQTVDGSAMGGGDKVTRLELEIPVLGEGPNLVFKDTFYCADMDPKFDLILSYPSLRTHKLGVLPHRNALVWEKEPNALLLVGTQATGVLPRYDLVPTRVSKTSTSPIATANTWEPLAPRHRERRRGGASGRQHCESGVTATEGPTAAGQPLPPVRPTPKMC